MKLFLDAAISTAKAAAVESVRHCQGNFQVEIKPDHTPVTVADRTRGYGDTHQYHRLASGQVDALIESDVNILDIATLYVIVGQADGRFTDLKGLSVGFDTTSVLAAAPELHRQLLPVLNEDGHPHE